jgi:hypothetical protein
MFTKPIVFVIGAGASYECGLPLGPQLVSRIARSLESSATRDEQLIPYLSDNCVSDRREQFQQAADDLKAVLKSTPSIDDALNWLSGNPLAVTLGKAGIVFEILRAERMSELMVADDPVRLAKHDATWLHHFFMMAKRDLRKENASRMFENTTIINFNYDRTIERYLSLALQQRGTFSSTEAEAIVSSIHVVRPYGSLGSLSPDNEICYGAIPGIHLLDVASRILTLTEQRTAAVDQEISAAILGAHVIVFLGFGFHPQNVRALAVESEEKSRNILGTVIGLNHEIIGQVKGYIGQAVKTNPAHVQFYALKAYEFLRDFELPILNAAN